MVATVLLSGLPEFVTLQDLAYSLDKLFDTDEIGTFRIRDLSNKTRTNFNVAIDFKTGFDAMTALEKLNGYVLKLDKKLYVLKAKLTRDKDLAPSRTPSPIKGGDKKRSLDEDSRALVPSCSFDSTRASTPQLMTKIKQLQHEELLAKQLRRTMKAKRRLQKEQKKRSSSSSSSTSSPEPPRRKRSHKRSKKLKSKDRHDSEITVSSDEDKRAKKARKKTRRSRSKTRKSRVSPKERSRSGTPQNELRTKLVYTPPPSTSHRSSSHYPEKRLRSRSPVKSRTCDRIPDTSPSERRRISTDRRMSPDRRRRQYSPDVRPRKSRTPDRLSSRRTPSTSTHDRSDRYSRNRSRSPRHSTKEYRYLTPERPSTYILHSSRAYDRQSPTPDRYRTSSDRYGTSSDRHRTSSDKYGTSSDRYGTSSDRHRSHLPDRYDTYDRYITPRESEARSIKKRSRRSPSTDLSVRGDYMDSEVYEKYNKKQLRNEPSTSSFATKFEESDIIEIERHRKMAIENVKARLISLLDQITSEKRRIITDNDRENVIYIFGETLVRRFNKLKVIERDMTYKDFERHYRRNYVKEDDLGLVLGVVDAVLKMDSEKSTIKKEFDKESLYGGLDLGQDNDDIWGVVNELLRDEQSDSSNESDLSPTRVTISLNIVPKTKHDGIVQSPKILRGQPKFVLPLKRILKEMGDYIETVRDEIRDKFIKVVRKNLRQRLVKILKGKDVMMTKDILALYRELFPFENDKSFVDFLLDEIENQKYDDLECSDLDEPIDIEKINEEILQRYSKKNQNKENLQNSQEEFPEEKTQEQNALNNTVNKNDEEASKSVIPNDQDTNIEVKQETEPTDTYDNIKMEVTESIIVKPETGISNEVKSEVKEECCDDDILVVERNKEVVVIDSDDPDAENLNDSKDLIVIGDVIDVKREPATCEDITVVRDKTRKTKRKESQGKSDVNSIIIERKERVKKSEVTITEIIDIDDNKIGGIKVEEITDEGTQINDQGAQITDQGAQMTDQGAQMTDQGAQMNDNSKVGTVIPANKDIRETVTQGIDKLADDENLMVLKQEPEESVPAIEKYMELFNVIDIQ